VLDFLHRASSAEQLGRDIEFPDEPDIGVRLGQRLLDARAALGGAYTDIAQVRAVRLIGPERFTEICVGALGLDVRRWVELFYGGAPLAVQAETGLAVSLDVLPQPAWLGQPLAVTVRVRDQGGSVRAGVPVTVQSGVGRLVYMFGFSRIEGQAVTVVTGADGTADLELITPPAEPLSEIQQAALITALARLDAGAPDPLKLAAAFRALAADYQLERSYNLRRAIDVYVRERREAMIDSLNPGRWRLVWPEDSALLQADALAPDGGGGSTARAVRAVRWKNWVGAWLEFFADALREANPLTERFSGAARAGSGVVGDLLLEARRFAAAAPGRTAEWIGQREIAGAVRDYVSGDLSGLDDAARAGVLTQLEVAAREVRPTTVGSYTLVSGTKAELASRIDAVALSADGKLAQMQGILAQVDAKAATVAALAQGVSSDRAAIDSKVATFNTQYTQFNTQYAQFSADFQVFNTNRVTLNNQIQNLSSGLDAVRLDVNTLSRTRGGG
jgi:hypothetical protein